MFVDLESVYPDYRNPAHEVSFEELRAIKRGWMSKNWRTQKEPLQPISGNAIAESQPAKPKVPSPDEALPEQLKQEVTVDGRHAPPQDQDGPYEGKTGKARKFKVQGETQTGNYMLLIATFCTQAHQSHSQNEV